MLSNVRFPTFYSEDNMGESPHIAATPMTYVFVNLSPADFEDLVRDLIGRELKIRFEAFTAGPDGGMDGRHAVGKGSTILQAKHYVRSTFAKLKSALKKERLSIAKIRPTPKRYVLATSCLLTPFNKAALAHTIGKTLKNDGDIFGPADLNGLLRKFPDVERANIKLWLSGAAVLERIARSTAHAFTATSRAEIEAKVKVYAQNPSFKEARDRLEGHHVVIISGPPGVGKTTLAEMLAYAYIGQEWEFVAIRSLDDGLAAIVDTKKQIFFFDDFLGKLALDTRALATRDSDLVQFIKRIRNSHNARFVLTTRAPIFEEARRVSEHLADPRLDIVKYVLDVGIYTRRIRARILYNHLFVTGTSKEHIQALWDREAIPQIVDHPTYNPRIIEAMTDRFHTGNVRHARYARAFLHALDNPHQLWDTAFRTHIRAMCRHLLFSLFFCSEYGVKIDDLKAAFNALHQRMCRTYLISHKAKDFEESLKILEGWFISINGSRVSFINPSLGDYLRDYLNDAPLLATIASTAQTAKWARSVWSHATEALRPEQQHLIARALKSVAGAFPTLPVFKIDPADPTVSRYHDLPLSDRISLLVSWAGAGGDTEFMTYALKIADDPIGGFRPWQDGVKLVTLRSAKDLAAKLEDGLVAVFRDRMWLDDLDRIYRAIEDNREALAADVFEAANDAIVRGIENSWEDAASIYSESTLQDHIKAFRRLAPRAGIPAKKLRRAISDIKSRISELRTGVEEASSPDFSGAAARERDKFDDAALRNLFATLLAA
jgi:DNA polymerase III delta prime subunit